MAAIRPTDVIAKKWADVTPLRSADYQSGVQNPRADWSEKAKAANEAWKGGIQAAVQQDRFQKGVTKAGTARWQEGAVTKGVQRWGPGVQIAQDKYGTGFAPYREAISRLTLPPRFARRDERNLQRVSAVVKAMITTKMAQS